MNKRLLFALPIALFALGSCDNPSSSLPSGDYEIKILTPAGAPTIALYDQGLNENWDSTSDVTSIPAAFATTGYDMIVFDGVNALNLQVAHPEYDDFSLALWLTGGNFHLVSAKHGSDEPIAENSTIYSFGENLLPDQVFKKLLSSHWEVNAENLDITYGAGVQSVKAVMEANPSAYDYYFIAEPVLTAVRNALPDVTVNEIYDLRSEWEAFSGQKAIPQAALFVRDSAYDAHKQAFDSFINGIKGNLADAINEPSKVKEKMNADIPTAQEQQKRFGFNANLAFALQNNGNRFGAVLPTEISDNRLFVNEFYETLNGTESRYAPELFI